MQAIGRRCEWVELQVTIPCHLRNLPRPALQCPPSPLSPHIISIHDELHDIAGVLAQLSNSRLGNQLTQLLQERGAGEWMKL